MAIARDGLGGMWWPRLLYRGGTFVAASVMDAANEALHMTGHVVIPGGGSKTISAAGGGKIFWTPGGSNVFSNASTNLRIGLQDPDTTTSPIRGDGTFDVYADLVGGTDTITNYGPRQDAMESGSKTLSDRDIVTIAFTMTARGGTDAVYVYTSYLTFPQNSNMLLPTVSQSTGSWAATNLGSIGGIVFDDGTVGWIDLMSPVSDDGSIAYNSGSATDEYGNAFTVLGEIEIDALGAMMTMSSASADWEFCLYSDPMGSPTLIEAVTMDATYLYVSTTMRNITATLSSRRTLSPGTYGITIRPTTANNVTIGDHELVVPGFSKGRSPGTSYAIGRADNSGAFSNIYTTSAYDRQMAVTMRVSGIGRPEWVIGQ